MSLENLAVGNSDVFMARNRVLAVRASAVRRVRTLRGDLRASAADGVGQSLMVGLGETYLPAFVLALGMGEIAAGLISTVPLLIGAVLQLASPWAVRRIGSRRRWVVACARFQAASLLLLSLLPFFGLRLSGLVFVGASLYWAGGLASGPAWNTWMEAVVPRRIRARFFAGRVRLSQMAILAGFMLGGFTLQAYAGSETSLWAFAALFAVAATSRFFSAECLAQQSEPPPCGEGDADWGLARTVGRLRDSANARLLAYLLAVQVAVYMSAPYFTPFMLSELQFTYAQYVALIGFGYLGKLLALPAWGRFAERAGPGRLLWIGGLGIVPSAAFWLISQSFWYLAFVQIVGGAVWAAYELAFFLLFFEAIPRPQRTSLLTIYNLANSAAMVGGGLLGAAFLGWFGAATRIYLALFATSSLARAAAVGLLARIPITRRAPSPSAAPVLATCTVRGRRIRFDDGCVAGVLGKGSSHGWSAARELGGTVVRSRRTSDGSRDLPGLLSPNAAGSSGA